ncbi:SDR family NAD(P)-dependent oxidoreductase [Leptolyngbyaceae cyanobacterium CCMR0082]|uniref:SDR family NAD(P)-dependent oxidoreductase n=1 Tax=Adonisia turfae CCMR0082 TaxID=2304604 RepID=A0A6M0S961_9CYAN|nr:SDR family NAD(P)-dependent oxidoreductase [Adonisia turfae CCMR0082]
MSVETRKDPIAIIGLSCRFPGSENPEAFWEFLRRGGDAITEIPDSRWDIDAFYDPDPAKPDKMNTRWGGFLPQVDQFDPQFFNISPREAINMDPQQRLLLEVAWEALENANIIPQQTSGKSVGVFTGISTHDYSVLTWGHTQNEPHAAIGTANSIVANRLSYLFNWTGPSMAIDTACSSSLVAVHLACQSLWRGESPLAIAGGANILLLPSSTVSFSKAGFMAADGRCKTFDARADGYVRSEGVGIVVLKPLSQALAEGDLIYAVIRGSAINQDGTSNGITAPNPVSQEAVLRAAYRDADVLPSQVHYVETHGTGTKLGDYIELKSLGKVLAEGRQPGDICRVGAVKANIGHLEAAAGIAGLIKVALSLKQREFPPQALFESPNPHIKFHKLPIRVQQKLEHLPEQDGPILVGISSFGFGGTNAHLVLESAPVQSGKQRPNSLQSHHPPEQRPLNLLTLSAKTDQALKALAVSYQNYLETHPEVDLTDICYTTNVGRSHFDHRLVVTANSISDLQQKLQDFCAGETAPGITEGVLAVTASQPKVAFLFSGQGSQYFRMGQKLYETQPIFRQSMEQCDAILKPHLDRSILEILYSAADPEAMEALLNQTAFTQPALFAIEYALCQLWKSWGIQPDVVMGHSVGEYVAACIAGVFSLDDGLKLIAARGRLMQALPRGGGMVAVMASGTKINAMLQAEGLESVAIAALNSPNNTVISGPLTDLQQITAVCVARQIKVTPLRVSHGFHSALMEPMLAEFRSVAEQISYQKPRLPMVVNVTGQYVTEHLATPDYWVNHVRSPVRFAEGMATLAGQGHKVFLEIGPKPILMSMGQQCLPTGDYLWLPSLYPKQGNDWQILLQSLGKLYVKGARINWSGVYQGYDPQKVTLPTYPFQRQRYWVEVTKQRTLPGQAMHPLLGIKTEVASGATLYSQQFAPNQGWLADHQVYQNTIMPGAAFAVMAMASQQDPTQLHDVTFERPLLVSELCELQLHLETGGEGEQQRFTIYSRTLSQAGTWQLHSYGRIGLASSGSEFINKYIDLEQLQSHLPSHSVDQMYEHLGATGLEFGPAFRGIQQLWGRTGESLAEVMLPEALVAAEQIEPIHPALLDACTQTLFGAMDETLDGGLYLPLRYGQLELQRSAPSHLFCYAQISEIDATEQTITSHLTFVDEQGNVFGGIQNFVIKRAASDNLLREQVQSTTQLLYKTQWQPVVRNQTVNIETTMAPWLILGEVDGCATLSEQLAAQEQSVLCGLPEQLAELLTQGIAPDPTEHAALTGIVLISTVNMDDMTAEVEENANTILQVVQTLLTQDVPLPHGLTLITQRAITVDATADVAPAQSALWGLGRTIQIEQPQLGLRLLDVDSLDTVSLSAGLMHSMESQCVLREELIFVPRLTRTQLDRTQLDVAESLNIRADGSYLITGGLGALGFQACQWLLEQGAQHVVLSSRRDADEAIRQQLTELEQTYDGTIEVQAADVTNPEQVSELINGFGQKWPHLAGLIHAAGILDDGSISEQTPERFARVLAPKVQGAWHLHQATVHHDLDFFVLYSSVASTLGSAGQSNYATANGFLDGLAQHRRALGRCGTSINWGPWANVGMAANANVRANVVKRGLVPLQAQDAHQAMAQLLATDTSTGIVLDVDWNRMGRHLGGVRSPILSQLISLPTLTGQSELVQQLRNALPSDRASLLLRHIQGELQRILGLAQLPNPDENFFDLGMDSLMAVEFRNRLQVQLRLDIPVTQFTGKASVLALAQFAHQQLNLKIFSIDSAKTPISHDSNAVSESDSVADLPKIPLPSLAETCDRYLEIVTPFLTEPEQRKTQAAVEKFLTGKGIKLQKLLEIHHNSTTKGYMYDFREQEFLSIRKPLSVFQNYNLLFEASPQVSELKWSRQIALLSSGVLHFYLKIKNGTLEPDKVGDIHLCMCQYARLFRTNRIPKIAQDNLYTPTQHQTLSPLANEHFIVAYDSQFYVVTIDLNKADTLVQQVERQIDDILSAPKEEIPTVGLLTTLHRTEWAVFRSALALSNATALKAIDAALFILCLDHEIPDTLETWSQQTLYGNGSNRWFDKTLQLIVTPGCKWGANVDHAPVDSLLIARLLRDISKYIDTFLDQQLVASVYPAQAQDKLMQSPTRLEWVLSNELTQSIERAKSEFDKLSQTFQFCSLAIEGLGEDLIARHQFKNPEAIAQLILQLAYARCHGQVDNIYQPVSTRHFRYGRTEVLRPVTPESLHLIQCFEQGANAEDGYAALCQAMAKHDQRKSLCMSGYGVDRHLFALHELAKQQNFMPEIFQDKAYTQILTKSVVATTGFMESFLTKFMGAKEDIERGMYPGSFAPDTPDGYGFSYILMGDCFLCVVTSWSESINQFTQCLQQSAEDVKALLISQMPTSKI